MTQMCIPLHMISFGRGSDIVEGGCCDGGVTAEEGDFQGWRFEMRERLSGSGRGGQ